MTVDPNPLLRTSAHARACGMQSQLRLRARNATRPARILDCLNSHHGFNIWEDVILRLPGYDEDSTVAANPQLSCDLFVADGLVYRFNSTDRKWQQIGHVR